MALRLRRGTEAERLSAPAFAEGELIYTTDTKKVYVGDGLTTGGKLVSAELSDDQNPSLSGDLNLNGNNIIGNGNININGAITATGTINLGDGVEDNVIVGGQIGSSLIPGADSIYDLGAPSVNWKHLYAEGASINGEITVGSIVTDGNIVRSDSTIIYNAETGSLTVGNITADIIDANFRGSVFADDSTPLLDAIGKTLDINSISFPSMTITNNIFEANDAGSEFLIRSEAPNTIILQGDTDGSYPTQTPVLAFHAHRGSFAVPEDAQAGDFVGAIRWRALSGLDYKAVTSISAQLAPTANLSHTSPKANTYIFTGAGDGEGVGGAGYHVLFLRGDGVMEGMLYKAVSIPEASLPFSGAEEEGMILFDSTNKQFRGWNGTNWVVLG